MDEIRAVDDEIGATPAQVALAWLLAQGTDIAPIPGTRRVVRVEENTAADAVVLTAEQLSRLDRLTPTIVARHDDANMAQHRPLTQPGPRATILTIPGPGRQRALTHQPLPLTRDGRLQSEGPASTSRNWRRSSPPHCR